MRINRETLVEHLSELVVVHFIVAFLVEATLTEGKLRYIGISSIIILFLLLLGMRFRKQQHAQRLARVYEERPEWFTATEHYLEAVADGLCHQPVAYDSSSAIALSGAPIVGDHERGVIPDLHLFLAQQDYSVLALLGSPGSGKSWALAATFHRFKDDFKARKCPHIPLHFHVDRLQGLTPQDLGEGPASVVCGLVEHVYGMEPEGSLKSFVAVAKAFANDPKRSFLIMIDALDEYLDKKNRQEVFSLLQAMFERTSGKGAGVRWIFTCREKEYAAFRIASVEHVRVRPLDLQLVHRFVVKKLGARERRELSPDDIHRLSQLRLTLTRAAEGRETVLRNPYYLALYIDAAADQTLSNPTYEPPDIRSLHLREIRREMCRGGALRSLALYDRWYVEQIQLCLSVLSYHLLKSQVSGQSNNASVALDDPEIRNDLVVQLKESLRKSGISEPQPSELIYAPFDEKTKERLSRAAPVPNDRNYNLILSHLIPGESASYSFEDELDTLLLRIAASLIDRSLEVNIILIDCEDGCIHGFLNQRLADFLAGLYLRGDRITELLAKQYMNFWLSRALAIAVATSSDTDSSSIIQLGQQKRDDRIDSALVDGLLLVSTERKRELAPTVRKFANMLLEKDRFVHKAEKQRIGNRDLVSSLRALTSVRRLLTGGYASCVSLGSDFDQLTRSTDRSLATLAIELKLVSDAAVPFGPGAWRARLRQLLQYSITLSFRSDGFHHRCFLALQEGLNEAQN